MKQATLIAPPQEPDFWNINWATNQPRPATITDFLGPLAGSCKRAYPSSTIRLRLAP